MPRTDKIFAGLILLAMLGFWVAMSPAAFTARTVDAAPAQLKTVKPDPSRQSDVRPVAAKPAARKRSPMRAPAQHWPEPEPETMTLEDGTVIEVMPELH